MRLLRHVIGIVMICTIVCVLIGCEYPAKVEPVTHSTIKTRVKEEKEEVPFLGTTTKTEPTTVTTTQLVVPEGYAPCSTCHGEKVICTYCSGTGRRPGEILDPSTGIVKSYYVDCGMCSLEDPGFYYCDTCQNKLILPIS